MNLSFIKDFFTCQANVQEKRLKKIENFIKTYPRINTYSLFKQLTIASVPELNALNFKKYMSQFSANLQIVEPHEINQSFPAKQFSNKKSPSDDQILQKGIVLFLNVWGNTFKQFAFDDFNRFFKGQECLPEKAQQVPYPAKKKLFEIFQSQMQGLLNLETLRQICMKQYKNFTDLFETLSNSQTNKIDKQSLTNLYLMHSQRMNDQFFDNIQKRMKLPIDFQKFLELFKKNQSEVNTKVKQRKVYYSSARRRKDQINYLDEDSVSNVANSKISFNYQTPQSHKVMNDRQMTSTKLTKGEKVADLKQASVNVSRFSLSQTPEGQRVQYGQYKQIQILGQILAIQEAYIQLKRNLCYRKDFDLELVWERQGYKFENILNQVYGICNFTSFVRFIVPQDFQHKYLAFVRHETSNGLSNETIQAIDDLFQAHDRKQFQINSLWQKIDRQMVFRMYCNPCDKHIKGEQLNKYFTQRESRVLLDRMDPLKTGQINYENFR